MTDFRSEAEKFVTSFLDYVETHDILDHFDRRTQKMERSPGVQALIAEAQTVFPPRVDDGKKATDNLPQEKIEILVESPNVIDRRDVFSARIQKNGAARGLLERVLNGDQEAVNLAAELIAADRGEKEFKIEQPK